MASYKYQICWLLCFSMINLFLPLVHSRIFSRNVRNAHYQPAVIDLKANSIVELDDMGDGRIKRSAPGDNQGKLIVNITRLDDKGHNEAIVHWSGKKSQMIFLLTRARNQTGVVSASSLYRSTDFGASFQSVTIGDSKTIIQHFYVCPTNKDKLIFYDSGGRRLYVTTDEGNRYMERILPPVPSSPDLFSFHPSEEDWVLLYSEADRKLYYSGDLAQTWDLVHEMVNPRFSWAVDGIDKDKSIIHLEVEDPTSGRFMYRAVRKPYPTPAFNEIDSDLGHIVVGSLAVQKEFIFVQKAGMTSALEEGPLYVSHNRGPFKRALFPQLSQHTDYMILDAVDGQVFIAANHKAGAISLYISDVTGRFYVKSLDHIVAINQADIFQVDVFEVKGMRGTYIVNQYSSKQPRTLISFDQGVNWREIPAPDKYENGTATGCNLPNCSLYIHLSMDSYLYGIPPPVSEEAAPGLILAQGVIGGDRKTRFIMSTDGGLTWKSVMTGTYLKTILDQGGAIVAVEFNSSNRIVSEIKYSCTEGETWNSHPFAGKNMKVDGLLNEPGITSLVSSLYGHSIGTKDEQANWIIAKLDFSMILNKACEQKDYTFWTPTDGDGGHGCLLGEKRVFERRKKEVECFNGQDYERAINITTCSCIRDDFECDYGYELAADGDTCTAAKWFDTSVPPEDCQIGQTYNKSNGYRKVAADLCRDSDEASRKKYEPVNTTCPVMKPEGLTVIVLGRDVLRSKTNITFRAILDKGNQTVTQFMWDFGDRSKFNASGASGSTVVHSYLKNGFFDVTVTARSTAGSETSQIKIWILDELSGIHVSTTRAARINRVTTLRAVPYFLNQQMSLSRGQTDKATDNVHYLWIFGDETDNKNRVGLLTWNSSVDHTYTKPGNYSVWVEAFNGVGSAFQNVIVPVYGCGKVVQLNLRGVESSSIGLGSSVTAFIDLLAETLKKVLVYELSVDEWRLEVEVDQYVASVAFVTVLPSDQSSTEDASINQIVEKLLARGLNKDLHFILPDEAFGSASNITVIRAVVVPDDVDSISTSSPMVGFLIAVPSIAAVIASFICIAVYHRRKLRSLNQYRVLRSRYRNGGGGPDSLLSDETDDDEPLIDPSHNEANSAQRLILSEDEDLQEAEIILSGARAGRNSNTLQINC